MTGKEDRFGFMKGAFETASHNARLHKLFEDGKEFIDTFLGHAQEAGSITRFFQQKGKEHPVLPSATFYIVGVDDEWRYEHAKKGRPRVNQEKSRVDYYMHAQTNPDQTLTISFTTSQHAHVAKKMGWKSGVCEFTVSKEKDLESVKAEKYVKDVAGFLANHAVILLHQGERRRRTMKAGGNDPAP